MASEIKRLPPLLLPNTDEVQDEKTKLFLKELIDILDEWRRKIGLVYNWEVIETVINNYITNQISECECEITVRRAKVQSVGTTTLTCKLLDANGAETGDNITVAPIKHLGSNDLTGDVWPDLAVGNVISVFQDLDDNYYTTFVFDDVCVC